MPIKHLQISWSDRTRKVSDQRPLGTKALTKGPLARVSFHWAVEFGEHLLSSWIWNSITHFGKRFSALQSLQSNISENFWLRKLSITGEVSVQSPLLNILSRWCEIQSTSSTIKRKLTYLDDQLILFCRPNFVDIKSVKIQFLCDLYSLRLLSLLYFCLEYLHTNWDEFVIMCQIEIVAIL